MFGIIVLGGLNMKRNNKIITVQDVDITISLINEEDYICITDFAIIKDKGSRAADVIRNWLRNRSTLDFLSTWEVLYNKDFKVFESEHFKKQVGLLTFTPSISEWVNKTNAKGLYVKKGKYGGTYAHKDIAFEFASAISPVFKLYLIKEFQRLKTEESENLEWNAKRFLSKNNYLIHTDAIKNYILLNSKYSKDKEWVVYATEADLLNVAIWGCMANEWRQANSDLALKGNIRDFASINELIILSNLETHNAELIKDNKSKGERFEILSNIAKYQLNILNSAEIIRNDQNKKDLIESSDDYKE